MSVVPHSFLFRYSFEIPFLGGATPSEKRLLALPEAGQIPAVAALDDQSAWADVRLAWNKAGIAVSVHVAGKKAAPVYSPTQLDVADCLQLWFDMRDTKSIHRASRFCQSFCLYPGSLKQGPIVQPVEIARAREASVLPNPNQIKVTRKLLKTSYRLAAWFPAEVLAGYDPENSRRIGFFYALRDSEHGEQLLAADRQFPIEADPSLWATLELGSETDGGRP